MKRYMLKVSYDGTVYCGWQVQPNGPTIEGVLNSALSELLHEDIRVIGASRTDSGVHALGNICVFDSDTRIPGEKLKMALNMRLPEDIRIRESCEVDESFHPRHADTVKTYEYKIYNDRIENPLLRLYSKFCYIPLDTDRMRRSAGYIVGKHDFTAFCSAGSSVQDKVRTVYSCEIIPSYVTGGEHETGDWQGRLITIRITGNGFLYNMVRIIAGTLMDVGAGRLAPEAVYDIIESRDRGAAGDTAEAKGLTLVEIKYL